MAVSGGSNYITEKQNGTAAAVPLENNQLIEGAATDLELQHQQPLELHDYVNLQECHQMMGQFQQQQLMLDSQQPTNQANVNTHQGSSSNDAVTSVQQQYNGTKYNSGKSRYNYNAEFSLSFKKLNVLCCFIVVDF